MVFNMQIAASRAAGYTFLVLLLVTALIKRFPNVTKKSFLDGLQHY